MVDWIEEKSGMYAYDIENVVMICNCSACLAMAQQQALLAHAMFVHVLPLQNPSFKHIGIFGHPHLLLMRASTGVPSLV